MIPAPVRFHSIAYLLAVANVNDKVMKIIIIGEQTLHVGVASWKEGASFRSLSMCWLTQVTYSVV